MYSALLAISMALFLPKSEAIAAKAISIPADTPEAVKKGPSSTQRALEIHTT